MSFWHVLKPIMSVALLEQVHLLLTPKCKAARRALGSNTLGKALTQQAACKLVRSEAAVQMKMRTGEEMSSRILISIRWYGPAFGS